MNLGMGIYNFISAICTLWVVSYLPHIYYSCTIRVDSRFPTGCRTEP